ncbi:MAG: amino acid ABC transporter permease [Steroidobacteraceae bacterium]|jgi:polar amino acid transport system permease protein
MRWWVIWNYRDALWSGFLLTVQISLLTIVGSALLGTLIACLRQLPSYFIERAAHAYTEIMRNIPSVVKVFFLYFVAGLDALPAAVLGLSLHQSSYIADVLDAGFRSIPREQSEAAWACGHNRSQIFLSVLLPQVWAITIPPLASQGIEIVKNSAAAMLLGIRELTFQTQNIDVETFRGFEAATVVTLIYLSLALSIAGTMTLLERRIQWR